MANSIAVARLATPLSASSVRLIYRWSVLRAPNVNRMIPAADMLVVETSFRLCCHHVLINSERYVHIPIDRAVPKFDLKRVQAFAIADRGNRAGGDPFARNVRDDRLF